MIQKYTIVLRQFQEYFYFLVKWTYNVKSVKGAKSSIEVGISVLGPFNITCTIAVAQNYQNGWQVHIGVKWVYRRQICPEI